MKCPFCSFLDTQVVDSRVSEEYDIIRRRRRCLACDKRFTTFETAEIRMPQVVKQNGLRVEFDADKVRVSFLRALHKRPVASQRIDEAIESLIQKVLTLGEREISSRHIGELVMKELAQLDKIAYIRFASVYRSFQKIDDFHDIIQEMNKT